MNLILTFLYCIKLYTYMKWIIFYHTIRLHELHLTNVYDDYYTFVAHLRLWVYATCILQCAFAMCICNETKQQRSILGSGTYCSYFKRHVVIRLQLILMKSRQNQPALPLLPITSNPITPIKYKNKTMRHKYVFCGCSMSACAKE